MAPNTFLNKASKCVYTLTRFSPVKLGSSGVLPELRKPLPIARYVEVALLPPLQSADTAFHGVIRATSANQAQLPVVKVIVGENLFYYVDK